MQIDIPAHIEKLLFLHDTLHIPEFGGFTSMRSNAALDYVGGKVHPPNKTLSFSENLTLDDGILVRDIADTHGITIEEARQAVNDFVEKMRDLLNQREIVTLPGIGRLYKNYVQKIQFLPDATNYSAESFGLPPLQFSPLARSREVAELTPTGTATPISKPVAAPDIAVTPPMAERSRWTSIWFVLSIFLALSASITLWWWRNQRPAEKKQVAKVEKTTEPEPSEASETAKPAKTNVAPEPKIETPEENPAPKGKDLDQVVKTEVDKKMKEARKELQNNGRLCILIVATLKEKANADRTIATLKKNGYEVYLGNKNGYQIGTQFYYQNMSDIQQKMLNLQKIFNTDEIWIKQK